MATSSHDRRKKRRLLEREYGSQSRSPHARSGSELHIATGTTAYYPTGQIAQAFEDEVFRR